MINGSDTRTVSIRFNYVGRPETIPGGREKSSSNALEHVPGIIATFLVEGEGNSYSGDFSRGRLNFSSVRS